MHRWWILRLGSTDVLAVLTDFRLCAFQAGGAEVGFTHTREFYKAACFVALIAQNRDSKLDQGLDGDGNNQVHLLCGSIKWSIHTTNILI